LEVRDLWEDAYGSYGINRLLFYWDDWEVKPVRERWKIPDVKGTSNIPLRLDSCWSEGFMRHTHVPPERDAVSRPSVAADFWIRSRAFCINRHDGGINGLFLDCSVRKIGLKELWTLKWREAFDTAGPWTKAGGVQPEDWPQWMRRFKDY
jgi:prepilin-type processing-associated H-X9-DG protein